MQLILRKIAKENSTTPDEVYREMQYAIQTAKNNSSPNARAKWDAVPSRDEIPTVEEFIDFMVSVLRALGY